MRKIIATEFYTLDGLMSDPKDEMAWVTSSFNEAMGKYENETYDNADTLLLGGVTYRIFESYWPKAASNPEAFEGDAEMAPKINNMRKIVFSKRIQKVTWHNAEIFSDIDPEKLAALKRAPGKNIIIVGSASIVRQLATLGLIDEYHLLLHPVILGTGKPLFSDMKDRVDLKLLESKDFGNGVVFLKYQGK